MRNLFQRAAAFFLKNQCQASSTHADQAPPICKAIIKKRSEFRYGEQSWYYYIDLYVDDVRIKTLNPLTEQKALELMASINANPAEYFFPEKIIDQVIFSNLA